MAETGWLTGAQTTWPAMLAHTATSSLTMQSTIIGKIGSGVEYAGRIPGTNVGNLRSSSSPSINLDALDTRLLVRRPECRNVDCEARIALDRLGSRDCGVASASAAALASRFAAGPGASDDAMPRAERCCCPADIVVRPGVGVRSTSSSVAAGDIVHSGSGLCRPPTAQSGSVQGEARGCCWLKATKRGPS